MIAIPKLTHRQKAAAITFAGIADFVQWMLLPALVPGLIADEILDFITVMVLIAICGFKWQFIGALFIELVPGLGLFPTWTAVALTLPSHDPNAQGFEPNVQASQPQQRYSPIEVTAVSVPPVQTPPVQRSH
jgi:hypothetical protein